MNPIFIILIGGVLAFVLLLIGIVISLPGKKSLVEERLGQYGEQEIQEEESKRITATPITNWLNKQVKRSSLGDKIAVQLAEADIKMKSGEYIALFIISAFVVGLAAWFVGGRSIIGGIIGIIIGMSLPRLYVKRQQKRRLLRFNEQLADMLNMMVNGLRAGYSIMQAMEAVSKELPPPISDEFRRVIQETQLGVSMERSLDNLFRRIPSDDLDLIITAINVQREVGGNLAEILDTISYTIRERVRIKGEIRVLTTQVMYSGRFLAMMPFFVILALYFMNRDYMMEFFKPENIPCGYIALGVAVVLIIAGFFVMNKLGDIEV